MTFDRASVRESVDDPRRLDAVDRSELIRTDPEDVFDGLTQLASLVTNAPFAFATVVDESISFWKSTHGLAPDAPRQNTVEESFCKYVIHSRAELVVGDAENDERTCDNPSVQSMGVRAWLGFPLVGSDGEVLGSFCVVDLVTREWSALEVQVVRTLAAAASREIALRDAVRRERAARTRAEALVQTLQSNLLPPALPQIAGLDLAAGFRPAGNGAELLGDFYDLFAVGGGDWIFVVGDVCGKGVEAAKVASFARHTIGAVASQSPHPAVILRELNTALFVRSPSPGTYLTAVCGAFSAREGGYDVRLARGGHPPPLLRHADGTVDRLEPAGQLVGAFEEIALDEMRVHMTPGETLVVYTDGVDEARRPSSSALFGDDALERLVAGYSPANHAAELVTTIERAALDFSGGTAVDDIAILVITVPGALR